MSLTFLLNHICQPKLNSDNSFILNEFFVYLFSTKDDYAALLDKLACPKCKTEQSFDEYHEKIRECRRCKEKFIKVKVCNVLAFERQQKEQEEKRQKRLLELEEAMQQCRAAVEAMGGKFGSAGKGVDERPRGGSRQ
jgi:uncharacterized protein YbaR (Trm112 family)